MKYIWEFDMNKRNLV